MMQCEQTFAWLGRYKKILNSTPKTHFHFILHRLVVGRNRYTERCYQDGKRPLLPSAKNMKKKKNFCHCLLFLRKKLKIIIKPVF